MLLLLIGGSQLSHEVKLNCTVGDWNYNLGTLSNLTALEISGSELVEIEAKVFQGMQDLEYLSLVANKLSSVLSNVIATIAKLRLFDLNSNQMEEIPNDIFSNNRKSKKIHLSSNKIKYLGDVLLNGPMKLNIVD